MRQSSSSSKSLVVISSLLLAASLSACSKGGSRPESWQRDGNAMSLLKLKCKSSKAFDVNQVNQDRLLKMSEGEAFVLRTYIVNEAPADNIIGKVQAPDLRLSQKSVENYQGSSDQVSISDKNCDTLTAEYAGPAALMLDVNELVNERVAGAITAIDEKSITIKSEALTITLEKVMPDKDKDSVAYGLALSDSEKGKGLTSLNITVLDNVTGMTTKLRQEISIEISPKVRAKNVKLDGYGLDKVIEELTQKNDEQLVEAVVQAERKKALATVDATVEASLAAKTDAMLVEAIVQAERKKDLATVETKQAEQELALKQSQRAAEESLAFNQDVQSSLDAQLNSSLSEQENKLTEKVNAELAAKVEAKLNSGK